MTNEKSNKMNPNVMSQFFKFYLVLLQYDVVGHSGDGHDITFVKPEKIPANNKERLDILRVSSLMAI